MDQQRGRSPSMGQQQSQYNKTEHSPSPHQFQDNTNSIGLGLGLQTPNNNQQFLNGGNFNTSNEFLNQQGQQNFANFTQNQDFDQQFKQEDQQSNFNQQPSFTQDLMGANNNFAGDFSLFSTSSSNQNEQLDPRFFMNELSPQSGNPSINPSELSSPPHNAPTPPNHLQPESHTPSSTHQSPSFNQGQFQRSPGHSRHASLGPESAAFPQGQNMEWNMMAPQFQGHRRSPSEYSDVSASSAHPSPNLAVHDSFEPHHSPNLNAHNDPMYDQVLGIGSFSLSDPQVNHGASPGRGLSPAHSPSISPRLGPAQLPTIHHMDRNQFMLGINNGFNGQQQMYGSQESEYPQINHNGSIDMGQAQQMVPPEINVEFAPTSRSNSFEPPKPTSFDTDALTPPDRGRNRRRAVSDPYNTGGGSVVSRTHTPTSLSPNIGSISPEVSRSLSPNDRSGANSPSRRRQSTSALPHANRDYILGLADPEYAAQVSDNGGAKRVQKHPATFQCTLCPKRFTRAYNLRSHLRTHTDERPFVCTVCGKAFARQHDRKRHEGLHSGEKKFVCKGDLKQGGQWGCGRRFARADALGRHFRSEAGRICIKPLLDEEAIERQRQWQEQRMQNMHMQQPQQLAMDANGFPMDASGNYSLPAALLAQYPALATLSWDNLPQGDHIDDDPSGRSSFDASGSEFYEEDDGYISTGTGQQHGYGQGQMNDAYSGGYSSDLGAR